MAKEKKKAGKRGSQQGGSLGGGGSDWTGASGISDVPGGGCFQAGTQIPVKEGTKSIENIKVGDEVRTYTKTGKVGISTVNELQVHPNNIDGLILNGIIKTTTNHPFYSEGHWVAAAELKIGDKILHVDGVEHTIDSIELDSDPKTVYNFEVDTTHTYFAEGYLVHNAKSPPKTKAPASDLSPITSSPGSGGKSPAAITPAANAEWKEYKKNDFGMASNNLSGGTSAGKGRMGKRALAINKPSSQAVQVPAVVEKKPVPVPKKK